MVKKDIWDILFWIAMIILIIYIIAKLLGLINTPEWLNLLPIITLAFAIGTFYQKVGEFMERTLNRTDYLKNSLDNVMNKVVSGLDNVVSKLTEHDKRLFAIEKQQEIFNKLLTIKTK